MTKKKIILYITMGVVIILGIVISNYTKKDYEVKETLGNDYTTNDIVIEISGEIYRQGIYFVNENYDVSDCIQLAGGLKSTASTDNLNLNQKVYNGMIIKIDTKDQNSNVEKKLSLNDANYQELIALEGIGEVTANKIINYRESVGKIKTIEELLTNKVITNAIYNKIKDIVTL